MARKNVTLVTCDLCGGSNCLTAVVALEGQNPFRVDLCPEHADPIRALAKSGTPSGKPRRPSISRAKVAATRGKAEKKVGGNAPRI